MKKIFTIVLVLLAVACSAQQKTVMDYATETVPVFGDYLYLIKSGTTDRKTTKAYFQQNVLSGTQYQIPRTNAGGNGFDQSAGLTYDGSIFYVLGNIGIGNTTPTALLHVEAVDGDTGVIRVQGGNDAVIAVGEVNSQIEFSSNDGSVQSTGKVAGKIVSVTEVDNGANCGMGFYTYKQTGNLLTEKLRITNDGKVGIGILAPTVELDVDGDAAVDRMYIQNTATHIDTADTDMALTSAKAGTVNLDDVAEELQINAQTGTSYTLVLTDKGKLVTLTNAAGITLTVPPNSSVAFEEEKTQISIVGLGAGQVTVAEGSGVTIIAADSKDKLRVLGSTATLIKLETDTWLLTGDISL